MFLPLGQLGKIHYLKPGQNTVLRLGTAEIVETVAKHDISVLIKLNQGRNSDN